jgi:hypothetical protein
MYENRKYVIFDTSETGSIQFYKPATYDETGSLLTEATASEVMETTGSTLRLNVSGSQTFVKYDRAPAQAEVLYQEGDIDIPSGSSVGDVRTAAVPEEEVPISVSGLTSKSQEYTHSEIRNILTGSEWVDSSMPER